VLSITLAHLICCGSSIGLDSFEGANYSTGEAFAIADYRLPISNSRNQSHLITNRNGNSQLALGNRHLAIARRSLTKGRPSLEIRPGLKLTLFYS
jgi:hypothetical protein